MLRSYKYQLLPNKNQKSKLDFYLINLCYLYNESLFERSSAYKKDKTQVNYFDQSKYIKTLRSNRDSIWHDMSAEIMHSPLRRLHNAFNAFFEGIKEGRKVGYPRFKSTNRYTSFHYGVINSKAKPKQDRVLVPCIGHIKFNKYRDLHEEGILKKITIKKSSSNKWYVLFALELPDSFKLPENLITENKVVGIDLGIKTLIHTSDNQVICNNRYLNKSAKLLAKRQRRLARKQKGSKSYGKQRIIVAKTYEHIVNQRLDYARKIAKELVNKYDCIVFENLQINNMVKSRYAKGILDASWSIITQACINKAEEAGKHVLFVDPKNTTQDCSGCSTKVPKDITVRIHCCPRCGLQIDRDLNASMNIKVRGLRMLEGGSADASSNELVLRLSVESEVSS